MAKEEGVNGYPSLAAKERAIPSVVCRRLLQQAKSIVTPAHTATGLWHYSHSTQHAWGGQGSDAPRHCQRWYQCPGCPVGPLGDRKGSSTPQNTRD